MQLFHPRIIAKHIENAVPPPANHVEILQGWAENLDLGIYDSETKNDGQFIQRILVDVLGYTESSGASDGWTLTKNHQIGSGNVDVALGNFESGKSDILAPFELKGAKTRDLDAIMAGRNKTPVEQAWEYGTDNKGTKWVLVSNYREIRLYAYGHGRKEYDGFDLSKLTNPKNYAHFLLLLSPKNLLNGHTLSLLRESEKVEKQITDALYQDYKALRSQLISSLTQQNPNVESLEIIQFSQTILDRILFIAFAEDKGLLPKETLKKAYETQNNYNPQPVWENFKGLFVAIDKGSPPLNITGYNGGLFSANPAIDNLSLSDELCEGFKKIGDYDFDSDVSVNILGHIFEQSITDLEEIKAHATGELDALDKKKSKRKKDGIFYTPPYITNYIVEQAVGGWLKDRQSEIGFDKLPALADEDYASIKIAKNGKVSQNAKVKKHIKAWQEYKTVLSNIKVLDPACGSGAFLNEVFDYLKNEGEAVNSQLTEFNGGQAHIFRWDTHILANNIYGVDLNNESVEITKLSLWLKTANKGEKLTYLDNNIKCGNSLIDDSAIAGDSAFDWNVEFADIMQAGGFDVVVGNPPYVFARENFSQDEKDCYVKKFISAQYQVNTYLLFIEQSLRKVKETSGRVNLIVPNAWLMVTSAKNLRHYILENSYIKRVTNLSGYSFDNVNVETIIVDLVKTKNLNGKSLEVYQSNEHKGFSHLHNKSQIDFNQNSDYEFQVFLNNLESDTIQKIIQTSQPLEKVCAIKTTLKAYQKGKGKPKQTSDDVKNRIYDFHEKVDKNTYKYLEGKDVNRYAVKWSGGYLQWGTHLAEPRNLEIFNSPRILIREITGKYPASVLATYVEETYLCNISNIAVIPESEEYSVFYILSLLNSNTLSYYFMRTNPKAVRQMFPKIILKDLRQFPIKMATPEEQAPLIIKAKAMLSKNTELHNVSSKFLGLLQAELPIDKLSKKLESWHLLDFAEFLDELKKKKISLSLEQKSEWMDYFEKQKTEALAIKSVIDNADREINRMVYELYGLTDDEIAIVEGQV
ncbi:MAG: TaqI-like C-terminal specificity domain-containing protein [Rickettsiales bacterium]|nr:TaqI-like C-terminal specificity domain-containing protein [Rickettsiales bacterium]